MKNAQKSGVFRCQEKYVGQEKKIDMKGLPRWHSG